MDYYAKPRSKKDEETLAKEGWRELTPEEVEEFTKCRNVSPTGKRDYERICSLLKDGKASIRYYKEDGVCVYIKEAGNYLPLGDGESNGLDVVFDALKKSGKGHKHEPI